MQLSRTALVLAIVGLVASTGFARQLQQTAPAPGPACTQTVAATAEAAGLTTLLAAVQQAGLTSTLSDPGLRYTVFAPTNEAFTNALPTLNATSEADLLASPLLETILLNHLVAYPIPAADLIGYGSVMTQNDNAVLNITSDLVGNETVVEVSTPVATAQVLMADIAACDSIVHVINEVLVPEI